MPSNYNVLPISRRAYFEIRKRLEDAGVLEGYTIKPRGKPEHITLPRIAFRIDKDFDDSFDCKNCTKENKCEVHRKTY